MSFLETIRRKFFAITPEYRRFVRPFPKFHELRQSLKTSGTVVGFYTRNSFYADEAKRMEKSARRLGLTVETTAMDGAGSWVKNAALKPTFLLEAREAHKGPLLYVDVDAVFHKDPWPKLDAIDADIGVFYSREGNLISATIFLADTPEVLELLRQWKNACDSQPEIWDQVTLQEILSNISDKRLSIARLPVSFCWVFDRFKNGFSDEVFIEQLQASRQATSKRRLFGRRSKRLVRRDERIKEIEHILAEDP
ncbi:nucleotide-diphospho-sugar transferase family protein (plasmid) [Ochrobactrum quorumnocens]|uniref:Nucleotide-diphospho-sugar transferase family protein n=2 Tax=Ochrobactrum quorumnocens TaxID=271865 RepID=A0A248UN03_9HYPH|nr:nucleotide-diphospho-sugar transferase family protein [[Ochrobactrum] quorumnocens]